ncbi:MAG: hypothetical protein HKN47_19955 [Pirellulaceae bacterium]|nr:hypothetical protein [Pirellulaceae bacterium]
MPAEFHHFRFSIAQLMVGCSICALVLCLNMRRNFECVTYSTGPAPAGRTDELTMRQGWPFPFLTLSELVHGATGPSEVPPKWPSPNAKRELLTKPLFINVGIWIVVLGMALIATLFILRFLTSRNNPANNLG